MSARIRGLLMLAVAVALVYPAFMLGSFVGDQAADLPQAIAEHPYSVLIGAVVNLLVLGYLLHWLRLGRCRTPQSSN